MALPIDEILEIVRQPSDPQQAWAQVLALCRATEPSALWDALPAPPLAADIKAAAAWLSAQLVSIPDNCGIYCGLDTLNMDGGDGYNIEIASAIGCDVTQDEIEWVFGALEFGSNYLFLGLYELHAIYSQQRWETNFDFADFILFLSYSGIVVGQALSQVCSTKNFLLVWGFHDGDLFVLGRNNDQGFVFHAIENSKDSRSGL